MNLKKDLIFEGIVSSALYTGKLTFTNKKRDEAVSFLIDFL
ncbi:MAG: hypothetical protein Q7J19_11140 [Lutibacter sp.]|nr:hypothetical protein [Lutibacter sp.]